MKNAFNWKLWAKGLLAAAIGSASTSAAAALSDPSMLHNPSGLAVMTGVGAALGGLSYLKKHPPVDDLPDAVEPMAAAGVAIAADVASVKLQQKQP